ncbi:MAG: amidohydrolase [Dehalococcoidia bacterium]|nr:amidohydrolase [Dehalococcoidia bacterium]
MRTYTVISADGHVETPPEAWVKYVPKQYRDRAPRLIKVEDGGEGWLVEGQPMLHNGANITPPTGTLGPKAAEGNARYRGESYYNPDGTPAPGAGPSIQRLREQDVDGIDCEVLFPPVYATAFVEKMDREAYLAMVQAYNTFLAQDYCSVAPDRLIGSAVIPVTGIDDAIAEMKRCQELGLKAVCFRQYPNGSEAPKPEDDRFWEKSLELGIALAPHIGFGGRSGTFNPSFRSFTESVAGRAGVRAYNIVQLLEARVFDRFPELRIYMAETNASWLPEALFFMDDGYRLYKNFYGINLTMLPSEYVKKHFRFSFIRDPLAMTLREHLPAEILMWGSDFPHSVGSFPNSRGWLDRIFEGVPAELQRRILVDNPVEFFHLDPTKALTETPGSAAARSPDHPRDS